MKPPGYYIQRSSGLFPVPISPESPGLEQVCQLFSLLGLFLAKCIQDGRRVDIPLAPGFFKLMCLTGVGENRRTSRGRSSSIDSTESLDDTEGTRQSFDPHPQDSNRVPAAKDKDEGTPARDGQGNAASDKEQMIMEESGAEEISKDDCKEELPSTTSSLPEKARTAVRSETETTSSPSSPSTSHPPTPAWFSGVLNSQDLFEVDPYRGRFLRDLRATIERKDTIQADTTLTGEEKSKRVAALTLGNQDGGTKLDDLL